MKDTKFYSLASVGIVRKYIGILDFFLSSISYEFLFVNLNPFRAWKCMEIH